MNRQILLSRRFRCSMQSQSIVHTSNPRLYSPSVQYVVYHPNPMQGKSMNHHASRPQLDPTSWPYPRAGRKNASVTIVTTITHGSNSRSRSHFRKLTALANAAINQDQNNKEPFWPPHSAVTLR